MKWKQWPRPITSMQGKAEAKRLVKRLLFPVPAHLAVNHRRLDHGGLEKIERSIRRHYHTGWRRPSRYSVEVYEKDLNDHLTGRLDAARRMVVPWLDEVSTLRDSRILEIGCGTGAATVALAEQGGRVTGIDIDEGALAVARDRCRVYGLAADLKYLNADRIETVFRPGEFDWILFFACLEHTTISERLASLKGAWELLPPGGRLGIIETPNRLWYLDGHTTDLPFFHWLPDELALDYTRFSPREGIRRMDRQGGPDAMAHFLRRGRGMSYHEIDLAIGPSWNLKEVHSFSSAYPVRYRLLKTLRQQRYKRFLRSVGPPIHEGFYDVGLDLVIRKR